MTRIDMLRRGETPKDDLPQISVEKPPEVGTPPMPAEWQTVTMAKIYAGQGHMEKAREIYQAILEREPNNEDARQGLTSMNS